MKISITAGEILDRGDWGKFCEDKGINPYAMNEGLVGSDEKFELSIKEAVKYNLIDDAENHICKGNLPY